MGSGGLSCVITPSKRLAGLRVRALRESRIFYAPLRGPTSTPATVAACDLTRARWCGEDLVLPSPRVCILPENEPSHRDCDDDQGTD
jgi:hypothetical protein